MIVVVEIASRAGTRAWKESEAPSLNAAVEAAKRQLRAYPTFRVLDIWSKTIGHSSEMSKKSGEFAPKIHGLACIGAVGQAEREAMLERQREGSAKATREGRYQGRVPTTRRQAAEIIRLRADGVTAREIAFRLGVGRARVYRVLSGGRPSGCVKSISTDAQTTHLPSAPYPADRMDRSFTAGSSPVAA